MPDKLPPTNAWLNNKRSGTNLGSWTFCESKMFQDFWLEYHSFLPTEGYQVIIQVYLQRLAMQLCCENHAFCIIIKVSGSLSHFAFASVWNQLVSTCPVSNPASSSRAFHPFLEKKDASIESHMKVTGMLRAYSPSALNALVGQSFAHTVQTRRDPPSTIHLAHLLTTAGISSRPKSKIERMT